MTHLIAIEATDKFVAFSLCSIFFISRIPGGVGTIVACHFTKLYDFYKLYIVLLRLLRVIVGALSVVRT